MNYNAYSLNYEFQNTNNENKNKKYKDKTTIENVGRPEAYVCIRRAAHVTKVVLCDPLPSLQKVAMFSFRKTSHWKWINVKLTRFAVRIAAPTENIRFTAAELYKGVLYFINTFAKICRYIEPSKRFFLGGGIAKKPSHRCCCFADLRQISIFFSAHP